MNMTCSNCNEAAKKIASKDAEIAALRAENNRLSNIIQGELRDPNGTIWECALREQQRAEKAEAALAQEHENFLSVHRLNMEGGLLLMAANKQIQSLRDEVKAQAVRMAWLECVARAVKKFSICEWSYFDAVLAKEPGKP